MDLKSNEPFWLIKNGLLQSYPSLKTDETYDILIIGGGITGSLIAHQCIEDGFRTILIDKREVCNGSTSATTSMLQYEIDVPLYELSEMIGENGAIKSYQSCSDSIDKIEKLSRKINSKAGFQRKSSLYFTTKKSDVKWLKKEFETRKKAGFKVKWLEANEIFAEFQLENTLGGILSEKGGSIDAFCFAHELLEFNHQKNLKIFDKTELIKVKYENDFNVAEMKNGYKIITKKIIYCNGYESQNLIKENFVKLKSTYAIISEIDQNKFKKQQNTLFWNTDSPYLYMRTTDDERFLIGGGDVDFKNGKMRDALLEKKQKEIEKSLKKVFSQYHFYTDFVWAGTFGETKDGLPYIGEHPEFPNSFFVLGFGGNGITFSVTGMEMVSHFLQNKLHPLSEYFRFGR